MSELIEPRESPCVGSDIESSVDLMRSLFNDKWIGLWVRCPRVSGGTDDFKAFREQGEIDIVKRDFES
jgi:hypothetical protein